jgi:hypothetical protein
MKNKLLFSGMAAASLLTAAVTATSYAAPTVVSDSALDEITGKAANITTASALAISVAFTGSDASANVQWGYYQWYDNHSSDTSKVKGGNRFDGSSSQVQASVTELNNAIFWGGLGQNSLTTGTMSGGSNMAYGTFAGGGF